MPDFYQFSRMKYAETEIPREKQLNPSFVDDVMIECKGGEFKVEFLDLNPDTPPSAHLCVFDESFGCFSEYPEFFEELFRYTENSITPTQLCLLLEIHGFTDKSDFAITVPPYKKTS